MAAPPQFSFCGVNPLGGSDGISQSADRVFGTGHLLRRARGGDRGLVKRVQVAIGLVALVLALALVPVALVRNSRSARPVAAGLLGAAAGGFHREQSAALFVGIRHFSDDPSLQEVPYAVDDAVDLAWAFAVDSNVRLVQPEHVVLALSGTPEKKESKERLRKLEEMGVTRTKATLTDVLKALDQQASAVGRDGLLIVSFATHGFSREGDAYLLASNSLLQHEETALSTGKVFYTATKYGGRRSLILLDACRDQLRTGRGAEPDPLSTAPLLAPLIRAMTRVEGQVVFYAAPAGKYAYDDVRKNGVFTAEVLDALRCHASKDRLGLVTVDTLHTYVEQHVLAWVRKYRDPGAKSAIQVNIEGATESMPLAVCSGTPPPPQSLPRISPAKVAANGTTLDAFAGDGKLLWRRSLRGHIARAEAGDLDGDEVNEVIAGLDDGEDAGKIVVFRGGGEPWWTGDTNGSPNYGGQAAMAVRTFALGEVYHKKTKQVVVLANDRSGSAGSVSVFDFDGTPHSSYWNPGWMQDVVVDKPTGRHAPKIVVSAVNAAAHSVLGVQGTVGSVFLLNPKKVSGEAPPYRGKLGTGSQLWYGAVLPPEQRVARLKIGDYDNDGEKDIAVWTITGQVIYLDFEGDVIGSGSSRPGHVSAQFSKIRQK
jgi:hypothetical protein